MILFSRCIFFIFLICIFGAKTKDSSTFRNIIVNSDLNHNSNNKCKIIIVEDDLITGNNTLKMIDAVMVKENQEPIEVALFNGKKFIKPKPTSTDRSVEHLGNPIVDNFSIIKFNKDEIKKMEEQEEKLLNETKIESATKLFEHYLKISKGSSNLIFMDHDLHSGSGLENSIPLISVLFRSENSNFLVPHSSGSNGEIIKNINPTSPKQTTILSKAMNFIRQVPKGLVSSVCSNRVSPDIPVHPEVNRPEVFRLPAIEKSLTPYSTKDPKVFQEYQNVIKEFLSKCRSSDPSVSRER